VTARPLLSLCLVVRDEAELLPRFLAAARGTWDELVAVDTGSLDETPRMLADAGATVRLRAWDGDFAAARNASLELARGTWILYLDPDELPSPALVAALREAAADPSCGAAALRFVNHLPNGGAREARLLRMFRADPTIRFRHRIHEDAAWAVLPLLERRGQRLAQLPGHVDHLGYGRERARARGKKERDVAILRRCVAEDPQDLYAWLKLLEQARFWADGALWAEAARGAVDALERAGATALGGVAGGARLAAPQAGELLALCADGLHPGDPAAALAFLERWARRAPPSAPLLLRRGELREALGRLAGAAADFEACLALAAAVADREVAAARPRLGLARLTLAAGQLDRAERLVAAVLPEAPRDPEALLFAAVLAAARGGAAAVARFAREHAARHGESEELVAAVREAGRMGGG
jgi:hypothetical protein